MKFLSKRMFMSIFGREQKKSQQLQCTCLKKKKKTKTQKAQKSHLWTVSQSEKINFRVQNLLFPTLLPLEAFQGQVGQGLAQWKVSLPWHRMEWDDPEAPLQPRPFMILNPPERCEVCLWFVMEKEMGEKHPWYFWRALMTFVRNSSFLNIQMFT